MRSGWTTSQSERKYVGWRRPDPAQALGSNKIAQFAGEVQDHRLVLQVGRWSRVMLSVDELMAPPVLREVEVILVGELQRAGTDLHGDSITLRS
jgi:hypothetical protein